MWFAHALSAVLALSATAAWAATGVRKGASPASHRPGSPRRVRCEPPPSPAGHLPRPAAACGHAPRQKGAALSPAVLPPGKPAEFDATTFAERADPSGAGDSLVHALSGRFWVGGQINLIAQGHGHFQALYSGQNSFSNQPEYAATSIQDFFSGARVTRNFDVLFDLEDVRGGGLSNTEGIAGFPDLDAQKTPSAGQQPHTYISRILLHYTVPLGGKEEQSDPSLLDLNAQASSRRFELYFGKFSLADFFDQNDYANSSRSQFMNWSTDQNGAWDYAANTPGYTYGAYLEFDDGAWSLRYAEALMTRLPNGLYLNLDVANSRAANAEVDWSYSAHTNGKLRVLSFVQQAPMGSFADALAAWHTGLTPVPEVSAVRRPDRHEYGFGLNWQQRLPGGFGLFARTGWNNGEYESYSYTEVNNAFEGGIEIPGGLWGRPKDHAGIAFASNGISRLHSEYLAAGGLGFQLGDGGLTYGRERIVETYYNVEFPRGLAIAPDVQFIANPGYNQARGPVTVFGMRLDWNFGFHHIP